MKHITSDCYSRISEVVKISSGLKLRKRRGASFALAVLTVAVSLAVGLLCLAVPAFNDLTEITLASKADSILYEAAERIDPSVYEGISKAEYGPDGTVTKVSIDPYKANLLRSGYVNRLSDILSEKENSVIEIPLGNLTGSIFLSGRGPKIKVYAVSSGNSGADIESSFSSAGINQTVHTVLINAEITLRAVYPFSKSLTRRVKIPVSETVIVGTVPGAYFGGIQ